MKTKEMIVTQRPLLTPKDAGYDPKRKLLNMNAEPVEIGRYDQIEECTDAELLAHMQEHYGCTDEEAVEKLYDAARRQYNTDRRNAIAGDYLNGGDKAAKEQRVNELLARAAAGEATSEDFAELKRLALKKK